MWTNQVSVIGHTHTDTQGHQFNPDDGVSLVRYGHVTCGVPAVC